MTSGQKSMEGRTAGSAVSWALGVTLGVIMGVGLLIAGPRLVPPAAAGATSAAGSTSTEASSASSSAKTETTSASSATDKSTTGKSTTDKSATETASSSEAASMAEGDPEAGKAVYAGAAGCAGCHGANGEGGVGVPLKTAATWNLAEFTQALREGKTPTRTLQAMMPRFDEGRVNPQQMADLHAFVQTLK